MLPERGPYRGTVARSPEPPWDLEVDGRPVRVTSPSKVMFPDTGATKADLVRYYLAVREPLLAAMGGRPVLMERYPDGVGGSSFFQKRVPAHAPGWLVTTVVETPNGTRSRALVAADTAHVVWAVNLGCIGFHVWPHQADSPGVVDELRIDLDPQPGVTWADVRWAAARVREALAEVGCTGGLKTSGGRGLHIFVRLQPRWDAVTVRAAAVALARELERRHPDRITAAWWKEERGARVFIDYNQNAPHKTVFGAWSVRPRPGAPVSCPVRWEDLGDLDPRDLTMTTVPDLVRTGGDPWADLPAGDLSGLLAWAARDAAAGLPDAPWPPVYPKMPGEAPRVAPSRARRRDA